MTGADVNKDGQERALCDNEIRANKYANESGDTVAERHFSEGKIFASPSGKDEDFPPRRAHDPKTFTSETFPTII